MKRKVKLSELIFLLLESIDCDSSDKTFRPDEQWLKSRYNELNEKLFNNALGECDLGLFTKGDGSQGGTLGYFTITGEGVRYELSTRKMFVRKNIFSSPLMPAYKNYINSRNDFCQLCKPIIRLNGNYTGTEHAWLGVLAHEMCHYYTYMGGRIPEQSHGDEFRVIAAIVSKKSDGLFNISRLAKADQMAEFELSDEMKNINDKRTATMKKGAVAIFVFIDDEVRLTITKSMPLKDEILDFCKDKQGCKKIAVSDDPSVIDFLFNHGCNKIMRTLRFWNIEDSPWLDEILDKLYDANYVYDKEKNITEESDDSDDSLPLTPGMNLSDESPLELGDNI